MPDPNPPVAEARRCIAVVLAAGEGTRMRSSRPKVLHEVARRAMLAHVLGAARDAGASAVAVVVGPGRDDVAKAARQVVPDADIFVQADRLGTAHAVLAARPALERGFDDVLIVFADTPLIAAATLVRLREPLRGGTAVAVAGFDAVDPTGYGRLVMDRDGLAAIREHKDASAEELRITLCNAGLMALRGDVALDLLERIENRNAKAEYYLTDAVEIARSSGLGAVAVTADEREVLGVNDRRQLAAAEQVMQERLRAAAMSKGVTLVAPETVFLSADTELGQDVLVEPNVIFGPGVAVEEEAVIHAFSHLEGARVARGASVGPFARLRPGASLGAKARVGNFVEIKNVDLGAGAKVNHLTYLGDATVGEGANIGAGTITCNYDGFAKHRTSIGRGAFIGSNSALVAPVTIGDGAYVGSGSVVTLSVPADALAVARGRQTVKEGWAEAFRAKASAAKAK